MEKIDELLKRLDGYNPPDRTVDRDMQTAIDLHDSATTIRTQQAEILKWRKALHSLTIGGSEFMTPEACVDFVRNARSDQHEMIKKLVLEKHEQQAEIERLKGDLRKENDITIHLDVIKACEYARGIEDAAKWHDHEAIEWGKASKSDKLKSSPSGVIFADEMAKAYTRCAAAIRALIPKQKEGE